MPESQRYRQSLIWIALSTLVMVLAMSTLMVFELRHRESIGRKDGLRSDSLTALAFHFEREFLRLQRVLDTNIHSSDSGKDSTSAETKAMAAT